jgi:NAD-dependent dihydropyrimidine dehydrogenase PreA subunit
MNGRRNNLVGLSKMEHPVKRILLIVFSGTGNTLFAARELKKHLEKTAPTDVCEMGQPFTLDGYDTIGLGYPVYAYNTPLVFLRYVKKLSTADGIADKNVFIFKTSGEPLRFNNASSIALIRLLKNCAFLGEYHFLMPYNIIFRFPDNLVKQMVLYVKKYAGKAAENILSGRFSPIKAGILDRIVSFVLKIQRLGGPLCGKFYSIDRKKCSLCLLCVKNCPATNISVQGFPEAARFRFGFKCLMCMRCSFFCPKDAINIGLLNPWKVNGQYDFAKLEKDDTLNGHFIDQNTRGVWEIYKGYFGESRVEYNEGKQS